MEQLPSRNFRKAETRSIPSQQLQIGSREVQEAETRRASPVSRNFVISSFRQICSHTSQSDARKYCQGTVDEQSKQTNNKKCASGTVEGGGDVRNRRRTNKQTKSPRYLHFDDVNLPLTPGFTWKPLLWTPPPNYPHPQPRLFTTPAHYNPRVLQILQPRLFTTPAL